MWNGSLLRLLIVIINVLRDGMKVFKLSWNIFVNIFICFN